MKDYGLNFKQYLNGYMNFLENSKTTRECITNIEKYIKENGYKKFSSNHSYSKDDKFFFSIENRGIFTAKIGDLSNPFIKIIVAHVDSPCLDIAQQYIRETDSFVYVKTHYYGAIKKYQWLTIPLDKEETGSYGATGGKSKLIECFLNEILRILNIKFIDIYKRSNAISADVVAAYDPTYSELYDTDNSFHINKGCCISKFNGGGGKFGITESSISLMNKLIKICDANDIKWQTGNMGKMDLGGGGSVTRFISNLGMLKLRYIKVKHYGMYLTFQQIKVVGFGMYLN